MAPAPADGSDGDAAPVYGLRGITHASGVLMTLMSAEGASALAGRLAPLAGVDLRLETPPGSLPVCHEIRAGALTRLVETLDVQVLDFADWSARKRELGGAVYR